MNGLQRRDDLIDMVEISIVGDDGVVVGDTGVGHIETVTSIPLAIGIEILIIGLGIDTLGIEHQIAHHREVSLIVVNRHGGVDSIEFSPHLFHVVSAPGAVLIEKSRIDLFLFIGSAIAFVGPEVKHL